MDLEKQKRIHAIKARMQDLTMWISDAKEEYDHAVRMCTGRSGGMNAGFLKADRDAAKVKLDNLVEKHRFATAELIREQEQVA